MDDAPILINDSDRAALSQVVIEVYGDILWGNDLMFRLFRAGDDDYAVVYSENQGTYTRILLNVTGVFGDCFNRYTPNELSLHVTGTMEYLLVLALSPDLTSIMEAEDAAPVDDPQP